MVSKQLFSLAVVLLKQQGAIGFFLAPKVKEIDRIHTDSGLFASKHPSGYKSFSSSFPTESKNDDDESLSIPQNDLSMFVVEDGESSQDDEQHPEGAFDAMEFFMTQDESIQRLEDVEETFREESNGPMMVEQERFIRREQIATTNPFGSDTIRMTKDTGIGIDEEPVPRKVMYYDYDGTLTKIKRNLCDEPVKFYSD